MNWCSKDCSFAAGTYSAPLSSREGGAFFQSVEGSLGQRISQWYHWATACSPRIGSRRGLFTLRGRVNGT